MNKGIDEHNTALFFFLVVGAFLLLDFGFAATGTNSTIMTVFITNTAPTLTFAAVQPNPALPGQTLNVTANITDANGDAITATYVVYDPSGASASGTIGLVHLSGLVYFNDTYTLDANAAPGTWSVNVTYNDGIATRVNTTTFTVNSVTSTTLQNTPIDFGNQTVGLTAQRAENGTAVAGTYNGVLAGFPLIINNTGNVKANYTINGSNLIGNTRPAEIIGVGNVTWNVTNTGVGSRTGKVALSTAQTKIASDIAAGNSQNVYFWIDTPNGVSEQRYNGTVVIVTTT